MRLGRLFDIPVSLHPLFVAGGAILLTWELLTQGPLVAATTGLLGLAVFGSVLLHELGHALAAKGFGIRTRSIVLHPLGGLASLDRGPETPTEELVVALAGPAVNAVVAGGAAALWGAGVEPAAWLLAINVGMGLFNLLPAFPMDGGRVLRAALATRMSRTDATAAAVRVARGFGWLFVATALVGQWNLALVGGFLLLFGTLETTWRETKAVQRVPPPRPPAFAHPTA